ncbi:MAG: hypothetical protein J5736_04835 [Bacilli bacterium]|nr:hypothetical protein [Bacilli bacterium]
MENKLFLSIPLFVMAIIAGPIGFTVACYVGNVRIFGIPGMSCYAWILLLFAILPILSIVFGVFAVRKGFKAKKNIIAGAISGCLTILIGLTSFTIECDQSGSFLREASSVTGISLPLEGRAMSYHSLDGRIGNAIVPEGKERTEFERAISENPWLNELTPASKGALPPMLLPQVEGFDRFCLFVSPTNTFNPKDFGPGTYSLTLISYKYSEAHLFVFDSYTVAFEPDLINSHITIT